MSWLTLHTLAVHVVTTAVAQRSAIARRQIQLPIKLLQHLSQIAGVYDHDSRCFHLTTLMLATSNLFEPVPVPIEAIEIADIFGPLRLDLIESGMCDQDGHKFKTTQHR